MGQAITTEQLTQEGIKEIKDVKESHAMMNLILRYMMKQINVNDLVRLSEPGTCKEYVISLAEHMSSQFSRLQIMPYHEKKSDVLLFKKYSDLDPSKKTDAQTEEQKKSLCLLLSYYYTRIFQIYGALAITLLNDISSSQTASKSFMAERPVNQTPGYEPTTVAHIQPWGARGGAQKEEIQASLFSFISSYLIEREPYSSTKGWKTIYDMMKPNGGRVFFDKVATSMTGGVTSDKGRFMIYPPATNDRYLILDVSATPIKETSEDVSLLYLSLKSSDGTVLSLPDSFKSRVSIRRPTGVSYMVHVEEKTNSVTTMDLSHYFQGVFQELITTFPTKGKTISEETPVSEEKVPDPLKLAITVRALQERRTAGHCIARALQLLRTVPSAIPGGPLSYESDICMEKFTFTARKHTGEVVTPKEIPATRGIPEYGKSLSTSGASSRGFHSFVQLFYDTIRIGSPQIVMGDKAFAEYQEFMRKMADLFRDDVPSVTPETAMDAGLAKVKNRRDDEMCKGEGMTQGKPIKVDPRANIKAVSEIVRELYGIQVKHAKQCGEIFESLFHITYDEKKNPLTISLSKNVLRGGFVEIDRINDRARKVLIDYYSMCEQKYVKGVNLIVEPMRREREVKRAADATRAAEAKAAEEKARTLPLTRTMSNQTAIRPVTATATATKPLLTFPTRPAAAPAATRPAATAAAPAAPTAAPAAPTAAPTSAPAARPLLPAMTAPVATPLLQAPALKASNTPASRTRAKVASAPRLTKTISKGGTRKRHVMRQ
jgi:hypothetical protein